MQYRHHSYQIKWATATDASFRAVRVSLRKQKKKTKTIFIDLTCAPLFELSTIYYAYNLFISLLAYTLKTKGCELCIKKEK